MGVMLIFSIICNEEKKIDDFLLDGLENCKDAKNLKPVDFSDAKMKLAKFFTDFKEFSIHGVDHAISTFIKHEYGNIEFADYVSFLRRSPNSNMLAHSLYFDYLSKVCKQCFETETEKILYFLLTYNQNIVVAKSGQKQDEKAFLGYEFSKRRGHEGIRLLPNGTMLFDENDVFNPKKVNSYVLNSFLGNFDISVDESISKHISIGRLSSFFEYGTNIFGKKTNLNNYKQEKSSTHAYASISELVADMNIINGFAFKSTNFRQNGQGENYLPVLKIANIKGGNVDLDNSEFHTTENYENFIAQPKSIAISLTGGAEGSGAVGKVAWLNKRGLVNQRVLVIEGDYNRLRYLYVFLSSNDFLSYSQYHSTGNAQKNISSSLLLDYQIPIFPVKIQQEIVTEFEKLDEKRQKLNDDILRCRRDIYNLYSVANVSKYPHKSLKQLASFNPPKTQIFGVDDNDMVSFVEMASISNEGHIWKNDARKFREVRRGYTYFADNDIIIAKITPCMENGKCALAKNLTNGIGMGSTEFHVIRCSDEIIPLYLFGFLNRTEIREAAKDQMTGSSGHRIVPVSFYEQLVVPMPSLYEQQKITDEIEVRNTKVFELTQTLTELDKEKAQVLSKYL